MVTQFTEAVKRIQVVGSPHGMALSDGTESRLLDTVNTKSKQLALCRVMNGRKSVIVEAGLPSDTSLDAWHVVRVENPRNWIVPGASRIAGVRA